MQSLKQRVCAANKAIGLEKLAALTWGNASEVDRAAGVFAIKPSGVEYQDLTPEDMVLISLETGEKVEGALSPSSDTATHWHLYREFPGIGGILHTHSPEATSWAQAMLPIPCFGTTHAYQFYGQVPCTRELTREEIEEAYELNTGKVITGHFREHGINPVEVPGVLVACHGPFVWGPNAAKAIACGITLEAVAGMARKSLAIAPGLVPVKSYLLDKHYTRKHGPNATYGQR